MHVGSYESYERTHPPLGSAPGGALRCAAHAVRMMYLRVRVRVMLLRAHGVFCVLCACGA
jgi:hypothetical protein